ncbi:MAG TPA: permease prefix domain 1-containing protein [Streptosporangiaceae bacterium]
MPESGLIAGQLAALAARLPARIVEELADGLDETYRCYLDRGLGNEAAARAAIAEFGDPQVIAASFTAAGPARRAARRLLVAGPGAGLCWGTVLIATRAWTWPVPDAARGVLGAALLLAVGLLARAAFGQSYRAVSHAAIAGCMCIAVLDTAMIGLSISLALTSRWPVVLAIVASTLRITYGIRSVARVCAG